MADHQALHGKDALVRLSQGDQLGQPVRLGKGVVVEQYNIFPVGRADTLVHREREAGVAAVLDQGVARPSLVAAGDGQALVRRTVVHHDQFKILLRLRPDGFDGIPQPAGAGF